MTSRLGCGLWTSVRSSSWTDSTPWISVTPRSCNGSEAQRSPRPPGWAVRPDRGRTRRPQARPRRSQLKRSPSRRIHHAVASVAASCHVRDAERIRSDAELMTCNGPSQGAVYWRVYEHPITMLTSTPTDSLNGGLCPISQRPRRAAFACLMICGLQSRSRLSDEVRR